MKKISLLLLMAICSICLTSCGGGDEDGGSTSGGSSANSDGGSSIVDGVHVNPRKLLSLDLCKQGDNKQNLHFAISYDSKGRLSKVIIQDETHYYNSPSWELLNIDYDLKLITCFGSEVSSRTRHYYFALNKYGFISRIGNCELTYNDAGYLIGSKTANDIWTFAYNEGEVIKYMIEPLTTGNAQICYTYYGDKDGELYFTVNSTNINPKSIKTWTESELFIISELILYHAGLFGNISKLCKKLSTYSNRGASIERNNRSNKITIKCSFKIE